MKNKFNSGTFVVMPLISDLPLRNRILLSLLSIGCITLRNNCNIKGHKLIILIEDMVLCLFLIFTLAFWNGYHISDEKTNACSIIPADKLGFQDSNLCLFDLKSCVFFSLNLGVSRQKATNGRNHLVWGTEYSLSRTVYIYIRKVDLSLLVHLVFVPLVATSVQL